MLEIVVQDDGIIRLEGRLDASQAEKAREVFKEIRSSCQIDFQQLEYISSAGLGVLLEAQQRLSRKGYALRLVNMRSHTRLVFEYAGFDTIFEID